MFVHCGEEHSESEYSEHWTTEQSEIAQKLLKHASQQGNWVSQSGDYHSKKECCSSKNKSNYNLFVRNPIVKIPPKIMQIKYL